MSDDAQLPDDVRAFVLKYIDSVAELEALLLTRSAAGQPWAVPELARRLYVTEAEAATVVRALHRRGLLSQDGDAFRYEPRHDELRRGVDGLAAAYPRFLIPLTKLVHGKPSASLRDFADAFRLREEK
jgi:hypothetical protein